MGRRAGFCLNSLLAQREGKVAAEVGGEPAFENLGISYLEFAAAMEDGREGALKQGGPGGREKFLKFPDSSQGFRWSGSIAVEEGGSGGEAQASTGSVGG